LAADHIILVDDGASAVSLPEVPLLAVLPGTGGLTRITDKRKVRRDRADAFCTTEEGIKGKRAVEWRLVDEVAPHSRLEAVIAARAREFAANSDQPPPDPSPALASAASGAGLARGSAREEAGIALTPLERKLSADRREYKYVSVAFDRVGRVATIVLRGPDVPPPNSAEEMASQGAAFWPLQVARELD